MTLRNLFDAFFPRSTSSVPVDRPSVTNLAACLLLITLTACGGSNQEPAKQAPVALHEFVVSDVPALNSCLGQISSALIKDPTQHAIGLSCLEGSLRGLTDDGSACALQVDAGAGVFHFEYGRDAVSIRWQDVSFPPGAPAIHNLENASLPTRPGIQLTRFTGGTEPLTETIVLRAGVNTTRGGTGVSLPSITYQRSDHLRSDQVQCRFGK